MKNLSPLALPAPGLLLSGCVAHKNQPAPPNTPPPVALNVTFTQAPVELLVQAVIIFQDPGSRARAAHWDEYVDRPRCDVGRDGELNPIAGTHDPLQLFIVSYDSVPRGLMEWSHPDGQPLRDEWEIAVRGLAQRVTDILAQPPSG